MRCEHPVIEPGAENHEIVEQLTRFRLRVKEIERREAKIIAGVSLARNWAQNLRQMAPALRLEIDTFRLATAQCATLQDSWFRNTDSLFNGGKRLQNYLDQRFHKVKWADGRDGGVDYEVCGKVSVSEIVFACERLLAQLEPRYEIIDELEESLVSSAFSQHLALEVIEGDGGGAEASGQSRDGLDTEQTAEGIQTLLGLEMRAEETMKLARAVQARAAAEAQSDAEVSPADGVAKPVEGAAGKREAQGRAPAGRFNLFEEIMLPMDADDFFAGVPGVDLGHA